MQVLLNLKVDPRMKSALKRLADKQFISVSAAVVELTVLDCKFDLVGAAGAAGACCIDFLGAATSFYAEDCFFANRVDSADATIDLNDHAVTGAIMQPSPYTLLRLTAAYDVIPAVQLYARAENVLNQVYEEPEGFQGRYFQAFFGVKAKF